VWRTVSAFTPFKTPRYSILTVFARLDLQGGDTMQLGFTTFKPAVTTPALHTVSHAANRFPRFGTVAQLSTSTLHDYLEASGVQKTLAQAKKPVRQEDTVCIALKPGSAPLEKQSLLDAVKLLPVFPNFLFKLWPENRTHAAEARAVFTSKPNQPYRQNAPTSLVAVNFSQAGNAEEAVEQINGATVDVLAKPSAKSYQSVYEVGVVPPQYPNVALVYLTKNRPLAEKLITQTESMNELSGHWLF
jgi:hypothetical protein